MVLPFTERDNVREKYRGYQKPRYSANQAPINAGEDDRRSSYLRNSYIDNVNATREQNAINDRNNNLDYAMSRSPEFYQNRDNLRSIKDVLVNTPAVTTDQSESRNMYQMLMNQMRGGDKGARLIDTSGLPAGATRTGRTLFSDPAKSQGFLGDLQSLFTGKNEAAVRAPEYNPFPKAGFGKEFYEDEFGTFDFGGLMESIFRMAPYTGGISKIASALGGNRDREPLERDPRFLPENNVFDINFDEMDNVPFMGDDLNINEEFVAPDGIGYSPYLEEVEETDLMAEALKDVERQALKDQIMANPATTDFGNLENLYDIKANTFDPKGYVEEQMNLGNMPNIETGFFEDFGSISSTPAANMDPDSLTTREALKDIAKLYYDNGSDIDKFFFDMFGYSPDDKYYQEGWETWLNPQAE
jgi:hypothetical protein